MTDNVDTLTEPTAPVQTVPTGTGGLLARLLIFVKTNKEFERFWKFLVVGGIGFVIDFSFSNLSWRLLPADLTIPLLFGKAITNVGLGGAFGFIAAIISNFVWNRYWTYPDSRSKPILGQFLMFLVINLMGIVIRIPILEITSGPFGRLVGTTLPQVGTGYLTFLGDGAPIWLGKNLALATAVIIVLFWNFFVNRYITYNDVD